jgi:hypothetical protein
MNTQTTAYNFGIQLACNFHGLDERDFEVIKSAQEMIDNEQHPAYGTLQRRIAKIAASMYEETEQMHKFEYHLYDQLSKRASWDAVLDEFIAPVYNALIELAEPEDGTKQAFTIRDKLLRVFGKAGLLAPDTAKFLIAGGALAGGAAGAGLWGINRHIEEDSDKIEAMKARRDLYRKLTREISDTLEAKRGPLDSELMSAIQSQTGAKEVVDETR